MILYSDAIRTARSMLGTPYGELDCIGLIVQIIRRSPGGMANYRCEGTNWLWDSVNNSGKYKHLTEREEDLSDARAGRLGFKRYGMDDEGHVGLITDVGTIIHSSSVAGKVIEEAFSAANGWDLIGTHRYVRPGEAPAEREENVTNYKAKVSLKDEASKLNVRSKPGMDGDVVGKLSHGETVKVQAEHDNGWKAVAYGDNGMGFVSGEFLERIEETEENIISSGTDITIIDSADNRFRPVGSWRVLVGGVD